jgi:outer membrane protein assembly factor BamB
MKLYVDTSNKQVTVSKGAVEKTDQTGRQKAERDTGRPLWSTQVFILDEDGGEVITVTTAGVRPEVKVGQVVTLSKLEALPWSTNGRSGVAFRAQEIKAATVSAVKSA